MIYPVNKHPLGSKTALLLFLCAGLGLFAGCAVTREGMVPTTFEITKKHPQSVSVNVKGIEAGHTPISETTFMEALTDAIVKSQTFSRVIEGKGGDYLLSVGIISLEQPVFGLSFTVDMEAGWTLQRVDNGSIVWQESIKSTHTATFGDAFVGVNRGRLATEGAARNNIAQGLAKISRLNL